MARVSRGREAHVCLGCGRSTTARSQVCNRCMYHQPIAEVLPIDDDDGDHDRFDEESGPDSLAPAAREVGVTRHWDSAGRPAQRMLA